ncbi:PIR Superfamily Protein [Plasmodium ovale wallikeri]|uniref:PIR Superfamily Protein n=1 Tax=Plasmodium ovale wallikeri TaxID=864142 RepID=A0A1A9AM50_PLAOA|nr:PIR Superfamily Protein [Plasmodium ovale wallikeri]SBT57289.1 PIR Superfamily Protein [Plasmodium ovale wallikeri]
MSTTSTYTLDKFAEQDSEFKNATLYKVYNKLLNSCNIGHDETYEGDDCTVDESQGKSDLLINMYISKVVNNLRRIGNHERFFFLYINYNENEVYTYFKYWFLDQILDKGFNDEEITTLFRRLNQKKEKYLNAPCELYTMNLNEIKIMKRIYDYYAFYHTYKGEHKNINEQISNSDYCENLKRGILYSNYYRTTCTKSPYGEKSICKEFNNYIKDHIKFEENVSSSIECVGRKSSLIQDENLEYRFSEDIQLSVAEDTEVEGQTTEDPGLTGNSMATVLPVSFVGTFSVLFLLYKFTPFRSFLHPQIQRMNNLWKNEDQETEELLINNYETEDFDSENKEYNITYHS